MAFNPELDGLGKVEPLKQHRKAVREQIAAPRNTALADALKKAVERQSMSPEADDPQGARSFRSMQSIK